MAEMTIRLVCDPATGKKDIIVSLRSDEDALPHEHEALHRELVEKLIEGGVLARDEVGSLQIEREEDAPAAATQETSADANEQQAQSEGS